MHSDAPYRTSTELLPTARLAATVPDQLHAQAHELAPVIPREHARGSSLNVLFAMPSAPVNCRPSLGFRRLEPR